MKIEFQNSVKNWVFCAFYQTSNRLDKPLVVVVVVGGGGGGGWGGGGGISEIP